MREIRVLDETIIFFCESTKLKGRPRTHRLRYWAFHGARSNVADGRVTLEYAYLGSSPVTSVEAFDRFNQRVNGVLIESRAG